MFRRRRDKAGAEDVDVTDIEDVDEPSEDEPDQPDAPPERPHGPWDSSEIDLEDEAEASGRIDLGALLVRPHPGMQVRVEVDQQAQRVRAVTFVMGSSGVQLQPFAAPRTTTIWDEVRQEIATDATQRGGLATELDGDFGRELKVRMVTTRPDGQQARQTTRVVGISGPRWLLRATYFGAAADPEHAGDLAAVVRDTVVVRGVEPMAPRDPLPLRMPEGATRAGGSDEDEDDA